MIKKLCLMIAAFAMGLFVSLSMQACAEDKDDAPAAKTPAADTHVFDAWKQPGLEYEEEYYDDGSLACRTDYKYNDKGWILEERYYAGTDVRYETRKTKTYTYSDSGDCQYCTVEKTYYENGTVTSYEKYRIVKKLNIK